MWIFFSELCNEGLAIKVNYAVNIFFMLLSAPFYPLQKRRLLQVHFKFKYISQVYFM